jgi:hypothetical protein
MSVPDCFVVVQASLTVLDQDRERQGFHGGFVTIVTLERAVHSLRQLIMKPGYLRRMTLAMHMREQAYG